MFTPDGSSAEITLRVDLDRAINFALQQNDVPVVKAIHIENAGNAPASDLTVRITTEPDFAEPWESKIDVVAAHSSYSINAIDLSLSPGYLANLTERIRGLVRIELLQANGQVAKISEDVTLLTRENWGGLSTLPEILAAFVVPNDPVVETVLRQASEILRKWTGDPSLSGYQSKDRKRVYVIAAAVYAALQNLDLTYILILLPALKPKARRYVSLRELRNPRWVLALILR